MATKSGIRKFQTNFKSSRANAPGGAGLQSPPPFCCLPDRGRLCRRFKEIGQMDINRSKKSVAVLPFENRSEDKANAYFADGIQDEILSMVAKIGDLKVISRTSTAKYKTRPENLRQVGEARHRDCSGRKRAEGGRSRPRHRPAYRCTSDNHIWSETYDRELNDIFNVQSEIAQKVARRLKSSSLPLTHNR